MTRTKTPIAEAGESAAATRHQVVQASPVGPLTLVGNGVAVTAIYMSEHRHAPASETFGQRVRNDAVLTEAARQLGAYFAGELTEFDLPTAAGGTEFQQRVWAGLKGIRYGEVISYGELATRINAPGASRAVGLANGRNPLSIVVPCHRVVGANGSLTGYGGGVQNKRVLLELEAQGANGGAAAPTLW
ncbi:methylated-DNA--[protein]-cysteine S-methyltransferase [Dermacoccaceae bacterium W4C1]